MWLFFFGGEGQLCGWVEGGDRGGERDCEEEGENGQD